MISTIFILFLISCAYAVPVQESSPERILRNGVKIIGGQDADIRDHPYQGVLLAYGSFYCGVVLIGSNRVATAAHCVQGLSPDLLQVRLGSSKASEGGDTYYVERSAPHPLYDSATIDYDIAYLVLSTEVPQSESVRAIDLATEEPSNGDVATVTGYGLISDSQLAEQLQVLSVPIVGRQECRAILGSNILTERMVCAGDLRGVADACNGDSGGPLVVGGLLAGLVSFGFGCATPGYPAVYSNVAYLRSYLLE